MVTRMTHPRTDSDMRTAVQAVIEETAWHSVDLVCDALVAKHAPATDDQAEHLRGWAARVYAEMNVGMMG